MAHLCFWFTGDSLRPQLWFTYDFIQFHLCFTYDLLMVRFSFLMVQLTCTSLMVKSVLIAANEFPSGHQRNLLN